MKTKKMIFMSLLVAQSLLLFIIENMISLTSIAPGAKIGLSNIVILTSLYIFSFKDAFVILMLKILLSTLIGGTLSTFIYSLVGGLLSLIAMALIKNLLKNSVSIIGVSMIGSTFHNIGQVLTATLMIQNINMLSYLPVLLALGIGSGIFVGYVSKYMLHQLNKIDFIKNIRGLSN